jgi:hypothetical protein
MFAWSSAGRLRPMRMVWWDTGHSYRFELVKYQRPCLRAFTRCDNTCIGGPGQTRVEQDRENRQRYPGRTGEWPKRYGKRRARR